MVYPACHLFQSLCHFPVQTCVVADEQGSSGYMLNMPLKQHLVDLSIMGELAGM